METLPMELITEVLVRLPVKSLLRCKLVCKTWKNLITTTTFTNLHLQQSHTTKTNRFAIVETKLSHNVYFIDVDTPDSLAVKLSLPLLPRPLHYWSFKSISSCNGLLCLCTSFSILLKINLFNPLTGTLFQLQSPETGFKCVTTGFGYDHINDDYKVVTLKAEDYYSPVKAMIYSLNAKSWRSINSGDFLMHSPSVTGALVNNHLLHWILYSRKSKKNEIACLDLCTEKWNTISYPSGRCSLTSDYDNLSVYNGYLCLYRQPRPNLLNPSPRYAWLLKVYGTKESWLTLEIDSGLSVFDSVFYEQPICPIPNGDDSKLLKRMQRGITNPGKECGKCWWLAFFTGSLVTVRDGRETIKN